MINAWELLLKARILCENNDDIQSIQAFRNTNGEKEPKINRSGNTITVGVLKAAETVRQYGSDKIDLACIKNLELLTEIRDNAIHFTNPPDGFCFKVHQIGTATLKNFVIAASKWFQLDLSQFNIFLMPLAFNPLTGIVDSIENTEHSEAVSRFLRLVEATERTCSLSAPEGYSVTLKMDLKFSRTANNLATHVRVVGNDSEVPAITLSEDQYYASYPWDYNKLVERLKSRYTNFKQNQDFYRLKKEFEKDPSICRVRYLDHRNQKGGKKKFYNPNILGRFDKHYSRNQT